MNKEVSI